MHVGPEVTGADAGIGLVEAKMSKSVMAEAKDGFMYVGYAGNY